MLLKNNQLKKLFFLIQKKNLCLSVPVYYRNNNFSINNHIIRKKFKTFQTRKRKKLDSNP